MFSAFVVTWLWHYRGTRLRVLSRNRKVENLADQLEMVARHAERVSLDPLCYCTLWAALLGLGKWEHVQPVAQRAPTFMFAPMRAYAKNCRDRARAFGKILRDHPPRWRRMMLDCLLLEVWHTTGRYHDAEVARLVTDAFEAAGKKSKQFTEDQIKKHRQRHVMPRIKLRQARLAGPILPTEKGTTTSLTF